VKLWVIVQNLGQLKRHYRDGWETFVANAGVITAFGNADLETLDYLSRKLGKVAMRIERGSGASSSALLAGARSTQEDAREWPLLDTDEAAQELAREKLRVLVLAAGRAPLLLRRTEYFRDPAFKGTFDE
jgi:type IV secretion system protein VirD4